MIDRIVFAETIGRLSFAFDIVAILGLIGASVLSLFDVLPFRYFFMGTVGLLLCQILLTVFI